jgi:hypothetical protein
VPVGQPSSSQQDERLLEQPTPPKPRSLEDCMDRSSKRSRQIRDRRGSLKSVR